MPKRYHLLIFTLIGLMVSCGPAVPAEPTDVPPADVPTESPEDSPTAVLDQGTVAEPTNTPPPLPEAYPVEPPPTPEPVEGYPPATPVTQPPVAYPDAYPAAEGFIWLLRPVGEQCAEPGTNQYADLREAVAALTAAGITVGQAEMVELNVCAACGCPTSAHFHVQIEAADLAAAQSLGWEREP